MAIPPLMSFIVLSYNYENYIGQTIRSILNQTVQDFEIIVVDDASADNSLEIVKSFGDPRIRLLVNEENLGGAGSYNRAIETAQGTWLVNLDADDWIVPTKSERMLDAIARDPRLDIIATHCAAVDANGHQHPDHERLAPYLQRTEDLNNLDNWVGHNLLCRSSTMVRREAHGMIGLDETTMIRAPDFELWTRALRHGCHFGMVKESLTYYRLHARGVTFGDPRGTFLEMSYAMLKNLVPVTLGGAKWNSFSRIVAWTLEAHELALLTPTERYNLIGSLMTACEPPSYQVFVESLQVQGAATEVGRRVLAYSRTNPLREQLHKSSADTASYIAARDWWQEQCKHWQRIAESRSTLVRTKNLLVELILRWKRSR